MRCERFWSRQHYREWLVRQADSETEAESRWERTCKS